MSEEMTVGRKCQVHQTYEPTKLVTGALLSLAVLLAALPVSAQERQAPGHYDPQGSAHGVSRGDLGHQSAELR